MQKIALPKQSEEWLAFRLGKSSGSKLKDIYSSKAITKETAIHYLNNKGIEINPRASTTEVLSNLTVDDIGKIKAQGDKKDGFYKLIAERVARPITPNDYETNGQAFSMALRGNLLEPEAIKEFEKRNKVKVDDYGEDVPVWIKDDNPSSIISPDATIGDNRAVEVKCLDTHRHIRAWHEDSYPSEYYPQILKYFIVNENLKTLHFVMYTDVLPAMPYLQFDIHREDVDSDITEYAIFEEEILKQVDELTERLSF